MQIQQCGDCAHWLFFPRAALPGLRLAPPGLARDLGQGTLYTFTVARVPAAEFTDELPQLLAVVQLDEGRT